MRICVLGLSQLGAISAAGLASLGHRVTGLDFDESRIAPLASGVAPGSEPGLEPLLRQGLSAGRLRFSSNVGDATRDIDVLWIACDVPLDNGNAAGTDEVLGQIERVLPALGADTLVLVCSHLPVGTVRRLEWTAALSGPGAPVRVACSPENLRAGSAVSDFLHRGRLVVGVRSELDKPPLLELLGPICGSIEWTTVESAEMTRHAINAFLATSMSFANELASMCESVGADAREVERGLRSDSRIGAAACLVPGAAFADSALERDVAFLNRTAREHGVDTPLLFAVLSGNDANRSCIRNRLRLLFPDLSRVTVAIWGLVRGSDTGTRLAPTSVELCTWLLHEGARIQLHAAEVSIPPDQWGAGVRLDQDALAAVRGAQVLVIAADSPIYQSISREQLLQCTDALVVLDTYEVLPHLAGDDARLKYLVA
ncbi:MAG TPA: nucleotide sugar dehydrogenase [Steroidobacteraceae bacterium]